LEDLATEELRIGLSTRVLVPSGFRHTFFMIDAWNTSG